MSIDVTTDEQSATVETSTESPAGSDRGASIVEYALLVALIAVVCIGAITFLGTSTDANLSRSTSSLFLGS